MDVSLRLIILRKMNNPGTLVLLGRDLHITGNELKLSLFAVLCLTAMNKLKVIWDNRDKIPARVQAKKSLVRVNE